LPEMWRHAGVAEELPTIEVLWVDDAGALFDEMGARVEPLWAGEPRARVCEPDPGVDFGVGSNPTASRVVIGATPRVGAVSRLHARDEVRAPVLADPRRIVAMAVSGGLRGWRTPWMRLDATSMELESKWGVAWRVRVGLFPGRFGRAAMLRIYPSPSMNLTIVQLLPQRRRRVPAPTFVHLGVRSVRRLVRALERGDL
jgi:hypothetical protein